MTTLLRKYLLVWTCAAAGAIEHAAGGWRFVLGFLLITTALTEIVMRWAHPPVRPSSPPQ